MRYFELDKNEKELLEDFDAGKLKGVAGAKKKVPRYKQYAKETLNKTRHINIRLSNKDLQKIKAKAVEKGMPYQTLIRSLLHQYSAGMVGDGV